MVQLWSEGPPVLLRHRPGEHRLQSASVCPPTAAKYFPAGHLVQFGASLPNVPRGHGLKQTQFVRALLLDVPFVHCKHDDRPVDSATLPTGQKLHSLIPAKGW